MLTFFIIVQAVGVIYEIVKRKKAQRAWKQDADQPVSTTKIPRTLKRAV